MSSIYIHVPFCTSRCIYCDFYSTTLQGKAFQYVQALCQEMEDRQTYLPADDPIRTVYIGGGTPSQLPVAELKELFDHLNTTFDLQAVEEITLEANPEDITPEFVAALTQKTPVNRVSMGVQSFIDSELKTLHRRHDSLKAVEAVRLLREAGIGNISIDLMYGLPNQTLESWNETIRRAIDIQTEHISAYCLSVEEGTLLARQIQSRRLTAADDETCLTMASVLRHCLSEAGFIQYEISNYARPGFHSRHNSAYWDGVAYLGLGPGAHSFDGVRQRGWNVPDVKEYLMGNRSFSSEELNPTDQYNECVMLGLRTRRGIDLQRLHARFEAEPQLIAYFKAGVPSLIERGWVRVEASQMALTEAGLNMADEVIRELFYTD